MTVAVTSIITLDFDNVNEPYVMSLQGSLVFKKETTPLFQERLGLGETSLIISFGFHTVHIVPIVSGKMVFTS